MERIISLLLILILTGVFTPTFADTPSQSTLGAPQTLTLPQCVKTFNVGYEKLILLTEAAISYNNWSVEEMQTQGGYIVFKVWSYKFLATVMNFGTNKAILKITPCNNNYTFPPGIIRNIFQYIEINQYKKF